MYFRQNLRELKQSLKKHIKVIGVLFYVVVKKMTIALKRKSHCEALL